ncbi:hypothetical protein C2I18_03960 [Paenibacillus sp. PK3_47]|uniref:hypothetical protein n=1 Tax=Paenibacillus sp. PK3_47 TaxID=2072642 RepID=UPI00201E6AB7|nr:hypothetical protein [Paenibacillus sp. PK3_47]UQZ32786.1 hypothetical protein C2I18_03960 [Paenibacillus sp. PK3_47]
MKTPELYELEYLFECEAKLSDDAIPWQYTSVSLQIIRNNIKAVFEFEEASRCGKLSLYFETEGISNYCLENISTIHIKREDNYECLILEFDEENFVLPLTLQTKPSIKTFWGTSLGLKR